MSAQQEYDAPTSTSMQLQRSEVEYEKESLLESVLPAPSHPRSRQRALSVAILSIFLVITLWMAATTKAIKESVDGLEQTAVGSGTGWVHGQDVAWNGSTASAGNAQPSIDEEDESVGIEGEDQLEQASAGGLANYLWHHDLEWDVNSSGRLIVVGDVHGMVHALKDLLKALEFSNDRTAEHNDTLVFVGDLVAKHPSIKSSLETVDYIRSLNAYAVRGNHDQDVINFRSYMDILEGFQTDTGVDNVDAQDLEEAPKDAPTILKHKWRDEHYKIAKAMSPEAAKWLTSKTLTLHIRSLHAYIVHAGLLPWIIPKNIGKLEADETQIDLSNALGITPETDLSISSSDSTFEPVTNTSSSKAPDRLDPEVAILTVQKLNRDPFTLLNMRGLLKNGRVTKDGKKGHPWAPVWNNVMSECNRTMHDRAEQLGQQAHPKMDKCRPINVIYGHAAARGLDLREYSFGLDSGAVYGRSLSALVVEGTQRRAQNVVINRKNKLKAKPVTIAGHEATVYSLKTTKP